MLVSTSRSPSSVETRPRKRSWYSLSVSAEPRARPKSAAADAIRRYAASARSRGPWARVTATRLDVSLTTGTAASRRAAPGRIHGMAGEPWFGRLGRARPVPFAAASRLWRGRGWGVGVGPDVAAPEPEHCRISSKRCTNVMQLDAPRLGDVGVGRLMYGWAAGLARPGVGSKASHPYRGNRTSTHACALVLETVYVWVLGLNEPGVYPMATRAGMPSARRSTAIVPANCWQ